MLLGNDDKQTTKEGTKLEDSLVHRQPFPGATHLNCSSVALTTMCVRIEMVEMNFDLRKDCATMSKVVVCPLARENPLKQTVRTEVNQGLLSWQHEGC